MYFEIYKKGLVVKLGNTTLNELSWSNELMTTPELPLTLPIEYLDYISGREHIKVFVNNKCFWGIVKDVALDKVNETIDVTLYHHIDEWNNRQISINNAVDDKNIDIIYIPSESGAVVRRNLANNEELVGYKISLRYSEFKGKSLDTINDFIAKNASVKAYNMTSQDEVKVSFVSSTVTREPLKTDPKVITAKQGTYSATFKTNAGSTITIPVTVAYATKESGSKGDASVDFNEAGVQDEVEDILNDSNFIYYEWYVDFEDGVQDTKINYVYSRQSKYEALTKTMELTDDLFWRVGFENNKNVEIGKFGKKKPYIVSTRPAGKTNIQILEEPRVDYDFADVVNVATVVSEKSDSGASCVTLRDLYRMQNDESLRSKYPTVWNEIKGLLKDFPIVIIRDARYTNVNNERNYFSTIGGNYTYDMFVSQSPKVAPNTSREYAIIDTESVAMEGGTIIEGSYSFNDIGPTTDIEYGEDDATKKLTDKERINAEVTAYKAAIKLLKQARRSYTASMLVSELPEDVNVGDKVRVIYDNKLWKLDACSNYWKKILSADDWYYITRIDYNVDKNGFETDEITISKYLKIERETDNAY